MVPVTTTGSEASAKPNTEVTVGIDAASAVLKRIPTPKPEARLPKRRRVTVPLKQVAGSLYVKDTNGKYGRVFIKKMAPKKRGIMSVAASVMKVAGIMGILMLMFTDLVVMDINRAGEYAFMEYLAVFTFAMIMAGILVFLSGFLSPRGRRTLALWMACTAVVMMINADIYLIMSYIYKEANKCGVINIIADNATAIVESVAIE